MGAPEFKNIQPAYGDYLNLPYAANGRERAGLDCWGLVRLVLQEQHGIELPTYLEIDANDHGAVRQAMLRAREGWLPVTQPESGDVVHLRLGDEMHVGVVTRQGWMLHVMRGERSSFARLDDTRWRNRILGFYRYTPVLTSATGCSIVAAPHPLRTAIIRADYAPGTSLLKLHRDMVAHEPHCDAWIEVDGRPVPRRLWADTVPAPGARIDYRALAAGGNIGRLIGMIAIMAVAWYAAPLIVGSMGFTAGSLGASIATGVVTAGINIAGSLLLNAIFPVRTPEAPSISTPKSMQFLSGGSNQLLPYGVLSCPLGRFRFAPPLAARSYMETVGSKSYLRMQLDVGSAGQISDPIIGTTPLSRFKEVEVAYLNGLDDTDEDFDRFNRIAGRDVDQDMPNLELEIGAGWIERQLSSEVDEVSVTYHFPQGVNERPLEGTKAGTVYPSQVKIAVQYKQVGAATWDEVAEKIQPESLNLSPAWYNIDDDAEIEQVYRWTRLSLDKHSQIIQRDGAFSAAQSSGPSGGLLERLQADNFGLDVPIERMPSLGPEEEPLYDICVYGNNIVQTLDRRDVTITGCTLTTSGRKVTIATGTIARAKSETIVIFRETEDAFSHTVKFKVPRGIPAIRTKRTDTKLEDFKNAQGRKSRRFTTTILQSITGYTHGLGYTPPFPRARMALRILATNQLNGQLDGITVTWQQHCLDYDHTTDTWIKRATRNPASIARYILQGPENPQPLTNSEINLTELADFHDWCRINGMTYEAGPMSDQRSVDDLLRDVLAAGRASRTERDGKWTVVIDRERENPLEEVTDCFTAHDSWGFAWERNYPIIPHAIRVNFTNRLKGYQPDERIVYADGYNANNATLFESWAYPGVTHPDRIFKDARFQLACLVHRSERFTANKIWDHFKTTRGDLVLANHRTAKFGLASGRVRERVSGTEVDLWEPVPMQAGEAYVIGFWADDGSYIERQVVAVDTDDYYYTVTLASSATAAQVVSGNMFQFGTLENGSGVILIAEGVRPSEGMSAQFDFTAYAPAVFSSDSEAIPPFDSQITLPAGLNRARITQTPTLATVVSDEQVLRVNGVAIEYIIRATFESAVTLPEDVVQIEAQIQPSGLDEGWKTTAIVPFGLAVDFTGVNAGSTYDLRFRYRGASGAFGIWSEPVAHTVVGLTDLEPVTGLQLVVQNGVQKMIWTQPANGVLVPADYEVRVGNSAIAGTRIANTVLPELHLLGDGHYWVAARYLTRAGQYVFTDWSNLLVEGATLVQNVVATFDEAAQAWPGERSSSLRINGDGNLMLQGSGNIWDSPNIWAVDNVFFYGGVAESGTYTLPEDEIVDVGRVADCGVSMTYDLDGRTLYDDIWALPNVWAVTDLFNTGANNMVSAQPQIAVAGEDGIFGGWQNLIPGGVTGRHFKFRLLIYSLDLAVSAVVSALVVEIDVPDRLEHHQIATSSSAAVAVPYGVAFNGGPGDSAIPLVQGTVINAQAGDDLVISDQTSTSCTVSVFNTGVRVVRMVNIQAQGF
jgi:hypothetical protein